MQNQALSSIIDDRSAKAQEKSTLPFWLSSISSLPELDVFYDAEAKTLWQYMKPLGRPSFTPGLIRDCTAVINAVELSHRTAQDETSQQVQYMILSSRIAGIYNLGGDLARFQKMIEARDREGLRHYAHSCVEAQYRRAIRMNLPICTVALVQGDALGGGFEVALSHDIIIAEKQAKFGLPEILFNLFPGMGAYSFLSRRLDSARATRLMTSGRLYCAEEMYEMGIVDILADDGDGADAAIGFIEQHRRAGKARMAIAKLREMVTPISRQELIDITDLWVETALSLDARDLRKMGHLVAAQNRRVPEPDAGETGVRRARA
ncbi:crotonase/enoyl-CoA hydratase family protein [Telmatospirillum sp.]|uniref:crotonase/enoyl-CoA hydratase family protein n=1 Tax=Telmatospirillum sp. TaxID=2079197 RepID=UPI00284447B2|nr:crotonase/enoyl-CoA hydratase family protein [Telmatospirillum sp.]MDR3437188.1 crotonase/enoyl-CoA hydratase family protein [Telmatospirillum sp.]